MDTIPAFVRMHTALPPTRRCIPFKSKCIGLLFLALWSGVSLLPAADDALDRFREHDASFNEGKGYSDDPEVDVLAWGETYFMNGYLSNYDVYGDTHWLDKVVEHFDRIKANSEDKDGDGYYGWYSSSGKYSLTLTFNTDFEEDGPAPTATTIVSNGGFENYGGDVTLPTDWVRDTGSSSVLYRATGAGEYLSGSAGMAVAYNGGTTAVISQDLTYTAGEYYTVDYAARTVNRTTGGWIEIYNATTDTVVKRSADFGDEAIFVDIWRRGSFNFRAPSSGSLKIRLRLMDDEQSDWKVYFDDIAIRPDEGPVVTRLATNWSFQDADGADATLPEDWVRFNSATSSNAYRTGTLNEYYNTNSNPHWGIALHADATNLPGLRQSLSYDAGEPYTVRFSGRVNHPDATGIAEIYDATTSTVLASTTFSNTDWLTTLGLSYTAPAAGHTLYIQFRHDGLSSEDYRVYVDNVELFDLVKRGARSWTRVNRTLDQAFATNDQDNVFGQYYAMVVGNDGVNDGWVEQPITGWMADTTHYATFYGRTNDATNGGKITIYDETASSVLASKVFTNTEYERLILEFDTPVDSDHVLKVRLSQNSYTDTSDYAYFDRVIIGSDYFSWPHDDGMIVLPALRFIKTIYDDPDLDAGYGAKADAYLTFIEDDVVPKWMDYINVVSGGKSIMAFDDSGDYRWFPGRTFPHNQYLIVGQCLLYLGDVTGDSDYTDIAQSLYENFPDYLKTNTVDSDALEWVYWDAVSPWDDGFWYQAPSGEDISHGALDVSAVKTAYRYGVVFDVDDMEGLAATVTDVMWNGSLTTPILGPRVNLPNTTTKYFVDSTAKLFSWLEYAEFDPEIWEIGEAIINTPGPVFLNGQKAEHVSLLARFHPERTVNGDFEWTDGHDATLPARWTRWLSSSTSAYRDATVSYKGDAGLTLVTNGTTWNTLEQKMTHYTPNSDYELRYFAKTDGSGNKARAQLYNYTTSTAVNSFSTTSTSWAEYTLSFTTPSSATDDLSIRLYQSAYTISGRKVNFDNLRLLPALWNSVVPNSGAEITDRFDSSLPKYWHRATGTLQSNALIDSTDFAKGEASFRLNSDPGSGAQRLAYKIKEWASGGTYKLSCQILTNGSTAGGRAYVYNETTSTVLASVDTTATSWTALDDTFTAPSNDTDVIMVYLTHDDTTQSGGVTYFDQVGVVLQ